VLARWRSDPQLHSPELTLRDQSERFILWFRLDRLLPPLSAVAFEGGMLLSVQPRRSSALPITVFVVVLTPAGPSIAAILSGGDGEGLG